MADRNSGIHLNAANRDITKISLYGVDANTSQVICGFWAKDKHLHKQNGL